jgi:hypothetical protein
MTWWMCTLRAEGKGCSVVLSVLLRLWLHCQEACVGTLRSCCGHVCHLPGLVHRLPCTQYNLAAVLPAI